MISQRVSLVAQPFGSFLSIFLTLHLVSSFVRGQSPEPVTRKITDQTSSRLESSKNDRKEPAANKKEALTSVVHLYFDPLQGASSTDLVQRALTSNMELWAARLDIERGRARLRQAGLRPNPTIDFEQASGPPVGSPGERATSIGIALPLEIGGQRRRRIELAQAELEATEAEVADRERKLSNEVLAAYSEALANLRELQITEEQNNLDLEMTRFVQLRVNEGETAPLDLNLLRVEADRLRSRRALAEGRLQAALVKLKNIVGIPASEMLQLKEDFAAPSLREPPSSLDSAIDIAMRTRPDLRLARLNEEVARAGLRLVRAQSAPEMTASAKYSSDRSITELPEPLVALPDQSRALSFGVSIGLPVFNRNQGAKAEASIAITQAQRRREFAETVVRAEVTSAYSRYEAATRAVSTFQQGVINRSNENIRTIRAAYQIGAFSITDLLVQQRQLLDSQREFTDALAERFRALADLDSAMGAPIKR